MMPPLRFNQISAICARHGVAWLALFGSEARGEATPASDVDLLVRFQGRRSLLDLIALEATFAEALGRRVDLQTEAALSPHLRERILREARVIYEA